jgi:hypothetical protein
MTPITFIPTSYGDVLCDRLIDGGSRSSSGRRLFRRRVPISPVARCQRKRRRPSEQKSMLVERPADVRAETPRHSWNGRRIVSFRHDERRIPGAGRHPGQASSPEQALSTRSSRPGIRPNSPRSMEFRRPARAHAQHHRRQVRRVRGRRYPRLRGGRV